MHIIVCVDKSNGMMFNGRRQSQDKELISKIIELTSGARLLMSQYSSQLFSEQDDVIVDNSFLTQARPGDFCFIEDGELPDENLDDVYIFNWNRDYPADKYFSLDLRANDYKRLKKTEFAGSSHKKITLEIYRRAPK